MVEKYLGECAEDIFQAAMITGMMNEKQAEEVASSLEKQAQSGTDPYSVLKNLLSGTGSILSGAWNTIKEAPPAVGKLALLGLGSGIVGATAYDVVKDKVSREDPKAELNAKMEAIYRGKTRELEDAKWMDRVRAMRDDLRRNYKKMTTEEYAEKYKALVDALDERS